MKVICKDNRYTDGAGKVIEYPFMVKGVIYNVYAVVIYEEGMKYLIFYTASDFDFLDSNMFKIVNSKMSKCWEISESMKDKSVSRYGFKEKSTPIVMGYSKIRLEDHRLGLINRDAEEISILLKYKILIDLYEFMDDLENKQYIVKYLKNLSKEYDLDLSYLEDLPKGENLKEILRYEIQKAINLVEEVLANQ